MALFLQILGANLSFLWVIGKVLDKNILEVLSPPYGELFLEYSWIMLAIGIPLVLLAQIIKLKTRRERNPKKQNDLSNINTPDSHSIERKDFYTESQTARGIKSSEKYTKNSSLLKDLAITVDWTPLSGGGASFKSSSLHKTSDSRLMIKSSSGMKLFAGFFATIGVIIPGAIAYMDYRDQGLEWSLLFPLFASLIFVAVGVAMLFFPRPRYLDKRLGWFWVGTKNPQGEQALRKLVKASPLKDLVALQIISEHISGKNKSYTSWELNIINKNATRYNLLDHGDKHSLLQDAETVASFLSIPIWDNT